MSKAPVRLAMMEWSTRGATHGIFLKQEKPEANFEKIGG